MYNVKLVYDNGLEGRVDEFESDLQESEIITLAEARYGEFLIDIQIIPIREKLAKVTDKPV